MILVTDLEPIHPADQMASWGLWTVEHQRVCSVDGKTRQWIFLVVADC